MHPVHQLESLFADVLKEWNSIRVDPIGSLDQWERRRVAFAAEEGELRSSGRWVHGRADYLGIIGKQRDELVHSRMIGWLLDPCGHHGLGVTVLARVMAHAGQVVDTHRLARARVSLEVPVAEGRMDIVVEGPGFSVVIENKVDADEGVGQCAYYVQHSARPDRCFVLLSPDGRSAHDAQEFRPLRYDEFALLLEEALREASDNAKGHRVAVDYLRTLRLEFQ